MEMFTQAERDGIEARLNALIANRPVMSKRIAEARELGDLRENGDYHAAREQQGIEEAEIRRLSERLAGASVVDDGNKASGIIFLGATVRMREAGTKEDELFKLVGEATGSVAGDVFEVTASSPMGEAMMKARVGETITVRTPRGSTRFEIMEIL